jgi:hypothetical protein
VRRSRPLRLVGCAVLLLRAVSPGVATTARATAPDDVQIGTSDRLGRIEWQVSMLAAFSETTWSAREPGGFA